MASASGPIRFYFVVEKKKKFFDGLEVFCGFFIKMSSKGN
jgi:hypothetical protein